MNNIDFDAIDLTKEAPVTEPGETVLLHCQSAEVCKRKSTADRKRSDFLRDNFRVSDERS